MFPERQIMNDFSMTWLNIAVSIFATLWFVLQRITAVRRR